MKNKFIIVFILILIISTFGFYFYYNNSKKPVSKSIPAKKTQVEEKFWNIIDWKDFEIAYSDFENNFSFIEEKLNNLEVDTFFNHDWVDVFLQMAYVCKKLSWLNPSNLSSVKSDLKNARPFLLISDPTNGSIYSKEELIEFNSKVDNFLYTDIWYNRFYQSITSIDIDSLVIAKNKNIKKLIEYYYNFYYKLNIQYNWWEPLDCKQLLKDNYFLSTLSYD